MKTILTPYRSPLFKGMLALSAVVVILVSMLVIAPFAMAASPDTVRAQAGPGESTTVVAKNGTTTIAPPTWPQDYTTKVASGDISANLLASYPSGQNGFGIVTTKYDPFGGFAWRTTSWCIWQYANNQVTNAYLDDWSFVPADSWYRLDSGPTVSGGYQSWNGNNHGCYHLVVSYVISDTVWKLGTIKTWYLTHEFYLYSNGTSSWHSHLI